MPSEPETDFRIECPDCPVSLNTDDLDEASRFAQKHEEHTGHEVEWVETPFNSGSGETTEYEVSCDVCDDTWRFMDQGDAEDFVAEHSQYTDHEAAGWNEITVEKPTIDPDKPATVKNYISEMSPKFDSGVPAQALYEQVDDGESMHRLTHSLVKLKQQGEVYEPQSDRYFAT